MFTIFVLIVWLAIGAYLFNHTDDIPFILPKGTPLTKNPINLKVMAVLWPVFGLVMWSFHWANKVFGKK